MINRRSFVRNAVLGSVFFPRLMGYNIYASKPKKPLRYITLYTPCGQFAPYWFPTYEIRQNKKIGEVDITPLKHFGREISPILGEWITPFREKMTLIRGLDIIPLKVRDHWPEKMTSGYGNQQVRHETIDQLLAYSGKLYQDKRMLEVLELKTPGYEPQDLAGATVSCRRFGNQTIPIFPITSPLQASERLFKKINVDHEVLNKVFAEAKTAKIKYQLTSEDKIRLDLYFSSMEDLLKKSAQPIPEECVPHITVDPRDRPAILTSYFDLIETAIKCDLCRVFSLSMGEAAEGLVYSFLPNARRGNFHGFTHVTTEDVFYGPLQDIYIWQSKMIAELLRRLDQVEDPETGETFLDNTIIYWGSSVGSKRTLSGISNNHKALDMSCVLFGTAGKRLRAGNFVDYMSNEHRIINENKFMLTNEYPGVGTPLNRLLITIMLAMGLEPKDWERDGVRGFGDYSGDNFNQYKNKYDPLSEILV